MDNIYNEISDESDDEVEDKDAKDEIMTEAKKLEQQK